MCIGSKFISTKALREKTSSTLLSLFTMILTASCFFESSSQRNFHPGIIDTQSATPGTAISFSNVAATSLTVTWGEGSDDQDRPGRLQYKLVKGLSSESVGSILAADSVTGGDIEMDWTTGQITREVIGLSKGTTYYFAVLVRDQAHNMSLYSPQSQITIPGPPSTVTVTPGAARNRISWPSATGASSYNMYWKTSAGVSTADTKISNVTSPYSHTNLTPGITYYYKISSVNAMGESELSSESSGEASWLSTKQIGIAVATTIANSVGVDGFGNVAVAGQVDGNLDGNALTGNVDFFVTKFSSSGVKQFTKTLGVSSKTTRAFGVTMTSSGYIYVAGQTDGGLDGNAAIGTNDLFVTKYDSSGNRLWTRQLGVGTKETRARRVASDSSGNVYVAGYTNGGLDGNSLTGTWDFFVTKYDSSGTKQFTKQLGAAGVATEGWGVAVDSSGNIFVSGFTYGNLDGNTLTGHTDLFVTKYNSAGTKQWTQQAGSATKDATSYGVTTDSSGNVYVGGHTDGPLYGNSMVGSFDLFLSKFNSAGTHQWTQQLGRAGKNVKVERIGKDSSGNILVTGYTDGGLDGNSLTGIQDMFVTKYDTSGSKQWTKQLGVAAVQTYGHDVVGDSYDNIFVAGETSGGLDGNTLIGITDFFATKYDSSGVKQ